MREKERVGGKNAHRMKKETRGEKEGMKSWLKKRKEMRKGRQEKACQGTMGNCAKV